MKRTSKKAKSFLKKDIENLEQDLEDLLSKKKQADDLHFLGKIAQDIQNLGEDVNAFKSYEQLKPTTHLIQHMLTTPWGAPFVADSTLLEAALTFEHQDPLKSDLYHLMDEFTQYSSLSHNQFLTILSSLSDEL